MFEATVAGSLPKPAWLAEPEKLWAPWRLDGQALKEGKRKATEEWLRIQEDAGIGVLSGGEQFRVHFVHGFLETINGIDWQKLTKMGIRDNRYEVEVPTVTGPVSRSGPVHSDEVRFIRETTDSKIKFTLPGPMTICDTIANGHYETRADMAMAFARLLNEEAKELESLGADVIQFDEPAFNAFMADTVEWGCDALNAARDGLQCKTAVHICYGYGIQQNIDWKKTLGDQWRQYEEIFPALNQSQIDQVSLECANSRVPLDLMALLTDKEVMVGVIDVATNEIETPEQVAAIIQSASEFVDPERILPCTNCGLAPLPMEVAVGKIKALGEGAQIAREKL